MAVPRLKILMGLFLVTGLLFWVFWRIQVLYSWNLVIQAIMKFLIYSDVLLWLNSAFMMRGIARGEDIDSREFLKDQVRLSLTFVVIVFISEIPVMIASI